MIRDLVQDPAEDEYEDASRLSPLDPFFAEGLITDVVRTEKSGKEGTVYCCRADPSTGYEYLAAKVYRPRTRRAFKNDAVYNEGRVLTNKRNQRAVARKSDWGRQTQFSMWLAQEHGTLTTLHELGSDVPRPLRLGESAILMEYLGDGESAAPMLSEVELEPEEVRPLLDRVLRNVELWLANDLVHGDLSPYNILYWQGKLTIIDFPQAVDARSNPNAFALLRRDVDHVCHYWAQYGVRTDASRIAEHQWGRFLRAEL